jgi:predicted acyl esterase
VTPATEDRNEQAAGGRSVAVAHAVESVVRDGTKLVADVYRPDGGGPSPTLLLRTPTGVRRARRAPIAIRPGTRGTAT